MTNKLVLTIKRSPLKSGIGIFIVLLALTMSFNSLITKLYLVHWFEKQGAEITIEEVKLSLLTSKLEIKGFRSNNRYPLAFDRLFIDWQWTPLFSHQVILDDFSLKQLQLGVATDHQQIVHLGSIDMLKLAAQEPESTEADPPQEKNDTNLKEPEDFWKINLAKWDLSVYELCIHDPEMLTPSFQALLSAKTRVTSSCLSSQLNWAGPIELTLSAETLYQMNGMLTINKVESFIQPDGAESIHLYSHNQLQLNNLLLNNQQAKLDSYLWQGLTVGELPEQNKSRTLLSATLDKLQIKTLESQMPSFDSAFGSLLLDNAVVYAQTQVDNNAHKLMELSQLALTNVSYQKQLLQLGELTLSELNLMESLSSSPDLDKFLAGFSSLSITQLSASPDSVDINTIENRGLFSDLILNSKGINLSHWLALSNDSAKAQDKDISQSNSKQQSTSKVDLNQPEPTPLKFQINKLRLLESGTIQFLDKSVNASHPVVIEQLSVKVNALNNLNKEFKAQLSAKLNQQGTIELKGTNRLNLSETYADMLLTVSGLNLAEFSPYSERYIGYRIDQGQLNSKTQIKVEPKKLDSELQLVLNKLELSDLEAHEENPLNADLGVPLPLALSLLKDSDNNIELDIPISGDPNAPDFSVGDVISTVSVKAIKTAIIYQYSPFGLLTLAGGVIDLATGLTFDPIAFETAKFNLGAEQKKQLEKIASLMKEKPQISLVICGKTNYQDLPPEMPFPPVVAKDQQAPKKPQLTEGQRQYLLKLAKQRQQAVHNHLVEQLGANATQLLSCNVKLEDADSSPAVVTISI